MTGNLFADILLEAKETDPLKDQLAKVMSDALRSSRTLWYLAQALEMDPKYSNQEELKQKVRELAALMAKRDDLMKEVIQSSLVKRELDKLGIAWNDVDGWIRAEHVRWKKPVLYQKAKHDPSAIVGVTVQGEEHYFSAPVPSRLPEVEKESAREGFKPPAQRPGLNTDVGIKKRLPWYQRKDEDEEE